MTIKAPPLAGERRPASPNGWRSRPRWAVGLDAAFAGALAAFALWTLVYEVALAMHWPATPVAWIWVALALPTGSVIAARTYRHSVTDAATPASEQHRDRPIRGAWDSGRRPRVLAGLGSAMAIGAALLAYGSGWVFRIGWGPAVVALVAAFALRTHTHRTASTRPASVRPASVRPASAGIIESAARATDLVIAAVSVLAAVVSLFAFRYSSDDAYYVNLSTWVAQRGSFPLRDTMFSSQVFPTSYGGGYPITSIEALIGALARLAHVHAGSMTYLVFAPVLGFASIWMLGSLARSWSRRHALSVFIWSVLFVVVATGGTYRGYSIFRVWEGKAAAIAILLPLIWVYATRLARTNGSHWVVMLGLVGIAFIGLTPTAAILAPALACAFVLAAVILRTKHLLYGGVALAAGPLLGGLAVAAAVARVGGPAPTARAPWDALHIAFGAKPTVVLLTLAGLMIGPLLIRELRAQTLAWCASIVSLGMLTPGLPTLVAAVTNAGRIQWRMLLTPPVPTLLGLCVTMILLRCLPIRLPAQLLEHLPSSGAASSTVARSTLALGMAATVLIAFTLAGTPAWASGLYVTSRPTWKVHLTSMANVRALLATHPPVGRPILMPADAMMALSIYTVRWHAVAPRGFYIGSLPEPRSLSSARRVLLHMEARGATVHPARITSALHVLNVGVVCVTAKKHAARRVVRAAGFATFTKVGTLRCARDPVTISDRMSPSAPGRTGMADRR